MIANASGHTKVMMMIIIMRTVAKTFVVCYIGNCVDLITRVPGLKDLNKRYGQSVCVCAT